MESKSSTPTRSRLSSALDNVGASPLATPSLLFLILILWLILALGLISIFLTSVRLVRDVQKDGESNVKLEQHQRAKSEPPTGLGSPPTDLSGSRESPQGDQQ